MKHRTWTTLGYIWLGSPVIGTLIHSDHKIGVALHHIKASDDDEFEYVETKRPQFGPDDDVEDVEVGSDPDDDDNEVELMKVGPAVRKEAHLSTVHEDQVLEDMEVSSRKSSGTASIRTPVQARLPPVLSAEVQVKAFVADQVRRWERDIS
ncbi:unnamed protein product [Phytophthora fragariaefolia]|uniref:Unnamed protein product n=1 Tax=Phytophthora fragariaefolia TaxID=1490495 RepID=A0A9W6Y7J6_9STRA|nr:unnamed protein product [Phytophthora fragariaefolia]